MPEGEDGMLDSRGKLRASYQTVNDLPSETIQSDAPKADITRILKKYRQVGVVDNLNTAEAMFKDITEFTDFSDAMRHAKMAEQDFMLLPSKVREIFNHDVAEWLDTAHDQEKRDALVAAGIIEASVVPSVPSGPPAVPAVTEAEDAEA